MANGLAEFSKRMKIVAELVAENASKTIRKAAIAADQVAVLATPVDTGRARAGWFVSVGKPSNEVGEPVGPPRPAKDDRSKPNSANEPIATQKALNQALAAVADYKVGSGDSIFLANNVAYIGILDAGRVDKHGSLQAPNGMTQAAVQAAREIIRKANAGR
jgi:hypothetical protein